MKKTKTLLIAIICLIFMVSCATLDQIKEEREQKRLWVEEYAPYYGLPTDIHLLPNTSIDNVVNNIVYYTLTGEYDFTLVFNSKEAASNMYKSFFINPSKTEHSYFTKVRNSYMDLMEYYCVGSEGVVSVKQVENTIKVSVDGTAITAEEYFENQIKGIELAKEYYSLAHDEGYIKAEMTKREIVEAYCKFLIEKIPDLPSPYLEKYEAFRVPGVLYGTYYYCFSLQPCMTPAKIHSLNILLRMEGITCQPVRYFNDDPDYPKYHDVVSRVLVNDGEILFAHWSGQIGYFIGTEEELPFNNRGVSLEPDYLKRF